MINLYTHGGSGNHGCEAIVRSTEQIIQKPIKLFSSHAEQDIQYGIDKICDVYSDIDLPVQKGSMKWILSSVETKLTGHIDLAIKYRRKKFLDNVSERDICLSIGGDNYCYAGTDILGALNNNLRKKGAKLVLWGCSVEPEIVHKSDVAKDLSKFDLITARESISYKALKKVNNNTILIPDSAFSLERKDLTLPYGWSDNMIGINASPLILGSGERKKRVYSAYCNLIKTILSETNFGIALIPHVVWEENDDRVVLNMLYKEFSDSGRVLLVEDHNCMELKGYIARCRMFIGARTHATIAAYSNCVPTLVLGYSVKSRGIARDLFGTEDNYVIPVQHMTDVNALANGFQWMLDHEKEIRNHLNGIMSNYIEKTYIAKEKLESL